MNPTPGDFSVDNFKVNSEVNSRWQLMHAGCVPAPAHQCFPLRVCFLTLLEGLQFVLSCFGSSSVLFLFQLLFLPCRYIFGDFTSKLKGGWEGGGGGE